MLLWYSGINGIDINGFPLIYQWGVINLTYYYSALFCIHVCINILTLRIIFFAQWTRRLVGSFPSRLFHCWGSYNRANKEVLQKGAVSNWFCNWYTVRLGIGLIRTGFGWKIPRTHPTISIRNSLWGYFTKENMSWLYKTQHWLYLSRL